MVELYNVFLYPIVLYAVYWVLDWLIRKPFVAKYTERWIVVTGCDTGFGHEIVKRLDRRGCHVFAGCFLESGEVELKKACSDRVTTLRLDVSKHDSVLKAFDIVKSKLPPGKGLWGLVNNAGVGGKAGQIEWFNLEDYQFTFSVNVLGTVDMTMTFLSLIKKEKGRVVNVTSAAGKFVMPQVACYALSKHGAEAFSEALRRSLRRFNCRVCVIEPGSHNTNISSKEAYERGIMAAWQQTTPEVREEFGEDYCKALMTKVYESRRSSSGFEDVLDAYEHALFSVSPRARYLVGFDARFIYIPSTYLPEWLSDWIFMDFLSKGAPIPASLRRA